MKATENVSQDTIPWSISSTKAVSVKDSISPKLEETEAMAVTSQGMGHSVNHTKRLLGREMKTNNNVQEEAEAGKKHRLRSKEASIWTWNVPPERKYWRLAFFEGKGHAMPKKYQLVWIELSIQTHRNEILLFNKSLPLLLCSTTNLSSS